MFGKLTEREIARLHKMNSDGVAACEIASALNIHSQTVYDHLALRVSYSVALYDKIGKTPKIPTGQEMTIYEAAILLPGWPSRDKVYRLYQAGTLRAKKVTRAGKKTLVTDRSNIADSASRMLPMPGNFISRESLESLSPAILLELSGRGVRLEYWPARTQLFFSMPDVTSKAAELSESISIPAGIVHRAILCLEMSGVATL